MISGVVTELFSDILMMVTAVGAPIDVDSLRWEYVILGQVK